MRNALIAPSLITSIRKKLKKETYFPFASTKFWIVQSIVMLMTILSYCGIVVEPLGIYGEMFFYVSAYFGCALLAIAVGHQAFHNALVPTPCINKILGIVTFLPLGVDGEMWSLRHRRDHHPHPNTHGHDDDIDSPMFFRLAPYTAARWYHQFQHLYAPIIYSLGTLLTIFVTDFTSLGHEVARIKTLREKLRLTASFLLRKGIFIGIWYLIPVGLTTHLTLAQAIIFHAIASVPVAWLFLPIAMAHLNEHTKFFVSSGTIEFCDRQIETTVDFAPHNWLITMLYGGLNSHAAHHLFPNVAACHHQALYQELGAQFQDSTLKIDLSLPQLFVSHFRFLKKNGATRT